MKFTASNENLHKFDHLNQILARQLPKASIFNKPNILKKNMQTLKDTKAPIILLTANLSKDNQSQLMELAKMHQVGLVVINNINGEKDFFEQIIKITTDQCQDQDKGFLKLHLESGIKFIRISNIIRLKAFSNYTYFYLNDNERPVICSKPLKHFAGKLNGFDFIRPHRSHLVNKNFIQSYSNENGHCMNLKNGESIAISRRKLKAVLQQL